MQSFSGRVRDLWYVWEIRGMILLSLCLQIILIIFGSRRKHISSFWIWILVWPAYLSADWVATFALSSMARYGGDCEYDFLKPSEKIQALWVPFLLLHLGGPDTITAYSLEDNELWLRYFLALVIQVGLACYVFFKSWNDIAFKFIAISIFISGVVKYGERTWVLRSSSSKHFRESLLVNPEIKHTLWTVEGTGEVILTRDVNKEKAVEPEKVGPDANYLCQADYLFRRFIYLFADLILDHYERVESYSIIHNKSPTEVFKLVAIELGFLFDVLYTKATIVYSRLGIPLRCISFLSSISALIAFAVFIDKNAFPIIDISITYSLLLGAVVIELYAFIVLIFSDWTMFWFTNLKHTWNSNYFRTHFSQSPLVNRYRKRWSESMRQHNLIHSCILESFTIRGFMSKSKFPTWEDVDEDLQALIFQQLLEKGNMISYDHYSIKLCKRLLNHRGDYVLGKKKCLDEFRWSTIEVEFDHSLLLWHIATDLCYFDDNIRHEDSCNLDSNCKNSKYLSDYMLYLLVMCPFMLPKGISEIRYRDTCTEFKKFLELKYTRGVYFNYRRYVERDAYTELLRVQVHRRVLELKEDQNKSVLFQGLELSKQLHLMESKRGWGRKKKWEMISEVWVEMLAYAASRCGWKEHAQQLRNGGELLTHVCLLMAHLGLSEQYQIEKQYIKRSQVSAWVINVTCLPLCCCCCCSSCCCCCCCGLLCIPIYMLGEKIITWVTTRRGNRRNISHSEAA